MKRLDGLADHANRGDVHVGVGEDDGMALTMHQTRQGDSFGVEMDEVERMPGGIKG
jgi:hypothetical protein